MLLQLTAFPQIPGPDRIVQSSSPKLRAFGRDIDARCTVSVTLELTHQFLVVQIPDGYVPVAAAAKADVRIGADGQCVTGRSGGGEFCFDARRRRVQVPDADRTGFSADDQRPVVRQEFTRPDVIVSLLWQESSVRGGTRGGQKKGVPDSLIVRQALWRWAG